MDRLTSLLLAVTLVACGGTPGEVYDQDDGSGGADGSEVTTDESGGDSDGEGTGGAVSSEGSGGEEASGGSTEEGSTGGSVEQSGGAESGSGGDESSGGTPSSGGATGSGGKSASCEVYEPAEKCWERAGMPPGSAGWDDSPLVMLQCTYANEFTETPDFASKVDCPEGTLDCDGDSVTGCEIQDTNSNDKCDTCDDPF